MISWLFKKMKDIAVKSNGVHLRQDNIRDVRDVVHLIDRFLDGTMNYGMEWDDFISWESAEVHVEIIRNEIGDFERLLFSKDRRDRAEYVEQITQVRNRLARLLGMPVRG